MSTQQLQTDKLNIINWISELQDYSLVEKIKTIMSKSQETSLIKEQKQAIDEAFDSIEKHGTKSHSSVMEETKKKFPHLFQR